MTLAWEAPSQYTGLGSSEPTKTSLWVLTKVYAEEEREMQPQGRERSRIHHAIAYQSMLASCDGLGKLIQHFMFPRGILREAALPGFEIIESVGPYKMSTTVSVHIDYLLNVPWGNINIYSHKDNTKRTK